MGDSVLALPKLNLQFLTMHDYLLRNFQLFQLESTYQIREDVIKTCEKIQPMLHRSGKTIFTGSFVRSFVCSFVRSFVRSRCIASSCSSFDALLMHFFSLSFSLSLFVFLFLSLSLSLLLISSCQCGRGVLIFASVSQCGCFYLLPLQVGPAWRLLLVVSLSRRCASPS